MDSRVGDPALHPSGAATPPSVQRDVTVHSALQHPMQQQRPSVRVTPATAAAYASAVQCSLAGKPVPHPTTTPRGAVCWYCAWAPPPTHPPLFFMHARGDDGCFKSTGAMLCRPSCYRRYLHECCSADATRQAHMELVMGDYLAHFGVLHAVPPGLPRSVLACFNALDGTGMSHAEWHAAAEDAECAGTTVVREDVPWTLAAAVIEAPRGLDPVARAAGQAPREGWSVVGGHRPPPLPSQSGDSTPEDGCSGAPSVLPSVYEEFLRDSTRHADANAASNAAAPKKPRPRRPKGGTKSTGGANAPAKSASDSLFAHFLSQHNRRTRESDKAGGAGAPTTQ